jgi:hypothetical protein
MPFVLRPPGEVLTLTDQLRGLARQRRAAVVSAGVFRVVSVLLLGIFAVCLIDAIFHWNPVSRAVALFALLTVGGALFYRSAWRALREPIRPLGMAMLLENRFPILNDALASAVEFDAAPPNPGSERFRAVATRRAVRSLEKCNTSVLVPSATALRNFLLMVLAGIVVLPFPLLASARTQVALRRLADPYGEHYWPTRTQLEILEPSQFPARLAKGDAFELRMKLGGVLPESVIVAVRIEHGGTWEETVPVPEGAATVECAARLDASRLPRDFQIQIRANDAITAWLPVGVAEPPRFVPFDGRPSPQLKAIYPEYTRLPSIDLPDGATVVEAIAGTRFRFRAATDRRIVSAVFVPQADRKPLAIAPAMTVATSTNPFLNHAAGELTRGALDDIPVAITGSNANELNAEFTPAFSGLYSLRFTDDNGITGTRLFDFRLMPDPAPVVSLDEPPPQSEPMVLLPTASIPFAARAEDRTYAVRKLALEYRVGGEGASWNEFPLNDAEQFPVAAAAVIGAPALLKETGFNVLQGGGTLALTRFGVSPGQRLTLRAAATDYDTVTACKQPGRSREVEIRVVSAAGLEGLLQQQLAAMRPQVLRLREDQRRVREKLEEVAQSPNAESPAKLSQIESEQQAIRNRVADPQEGLKSKALRLQDSIRKNALPKSPTTDRVDAVAEELANLAEQTLEGIEPKLADARKNPMGDGAKKGVIQQKAVEQSFDRILEQLERWGGAGETRAEAQALKEALNQAAADAAKASEKVQPGKPESELDPSEKAALGKPAEKLNQLAERTASALGKAERQAAEKGQNTGKSPEADAEAKALRNAIENAGGQQLVDDIRTAAKQLEANAPAKSAEAIRSAQERLTKFADALTEKEPDAGDQLEKKKATADAIDKLAEEQDQLAKKAKAAANDPDELMKLAPEQQALKKKVEEAAEKLSRDRQMEAAEKLRDAAEKMAAAQAALEEGKAPGEQQNEALDRIEEAVNKLDRERTNDEAKLAKENAEKIVAQLKAIREKLAAAEAEAVRLQKDVVQQKAWDRAKVASLGDLDDRIRSVADELRRFAAANFESLPVFKQLAEQADESAERASKRIAERKIDVLDAIGEPFDEAVEAIADDRCRRPLKTAIRRIDHILEAMKEDPKKNAKPAEKPDAPPEMPPEMPMPMGEQPQPPTAQIKALRALQVELNERTVAFAKAHPDRMKLNEADREELEELERSQREVAGLFKELAPAFEKKPVQEVP